MAGIPISRYKGLLIVFLAVSMSFALESYEMESQWCLNDGDCAALEYCVQTANPDNNHCAALDCGAGEYPENHECLPGCADDGGCDSNEDCIDHECVMKQDACSSDSDCPYDEYCVPAADYDKCVPVTEGDCGFVSNHQWMDYECCLDSDCASGEICTMHGCIAEGTEAPECGGEMQFRVAYDKVTGNLVALVGGLEDCNNRMVYIKKEDCDGRIVCNFISGNEGGTCQFAIPSGTGNFTYAACSDIDGDGAEERDLIVLEVEEEVAKGPCQSTGCTLVWGECLCPAGETAGVSTGSCRDNCGVVTTQEKLCTCEIPQEESSNVSTGEPEETVAGQEEETTDNTQTILIAAVALLALAVLYLLYKSMKK